VSRARIIAVTNNVNLSGLLFPMAVFYTAGQQRRSFRSFQSFPIRFHVSARAPTRSVESRDASRAKPRRLNGSAGIWFSHSFFCAGSFTDCDHTVITVTFVCTWIHYPWLLIYVFFFFFLSVEHFTWCLSSSKYDGTLFRVILFSLIIKEFSMFSAKLYFVCDIFSILYFIFRIKRWYF